MRFQRIIQTISLTVFLGLLLYAAYPYPEGLAADFFLRLDPLISVGTMVTVRSFLPVLLPGLVVVLCALLVGRIFCGHICPMGTTIDMAQAPPTLFAKIAIEEIRLRSEFALPGIEIPSCWQASSQPVSCRFPWFMWPHPSLWSLDYTVYHCTVWPAW